MVNKNPSTIQAVQAISLPDQIYIEIRRAILTGELPAGCRILEMEIAGRTGASQASVRSALAQLEADSLVERRSRSGTYVTEVPEEEVRSLFRIRAQVEMLAVRRAAMQMTPGDWNELEHLVEGMLASAQNDDMLSLGEGDMLFHHKIVAASGSTALLRAWLPLYSPIQRYMTQNHRRHFADLSEVARLHTPVIAALHMHDSDRAAEEIEKHILLTVQQ